MHEYSLVEALMRRVEEEARTRNATAIHRLRVRIGSLAGVERGLFRDAYHLCRQGTVCSGAELVIEPVEARWACERCARPVAPGEILCCPACGSPARLLAGDEILLDRIEMEVP